MDIKIVNTLFFLKQGLNGGRIKLKAINSMILIIKEK